VAFGFLALAAVPSQSASIGWASGFKPAMEQARAEQKFVMVDFYTHWCTWCKVMDAKTFTDPKVAALAEGMVAVKVNAEAERAVAGQYGVRAFPTIVFLNPDGTLRQRVQGYKPPEGMIPILEDVLKTDAELYGLRANLRGNPGERAIRWELARTLARSRDYRGAASHMDTLLSSAGDREENKVEQELERLIFLHQAGETNGVRKGLEAWVRKAKKGHPRLSEGRYFLALACEKDGKHKDARKALQEISKSDPGSWFAEEARERLARS